MPEQRPTPPDFKEAMEIQMIYTALANEALGSYMVDPGRVTAIRGVFARLCVVEGAVGIPATMCATNEVHIGWYGDEEAALTPALRPAGVVRRSTPVPQSSSAGFATRPQPPRCVRSRSSSGARGGRPRIAAERSRKKQQARSGARQRRGSDAGRSRESPAVVQTGRLRSIRLPAGRDDPDGAEQRPRGCSSTARSGPSRSTASRSRHQHPEQ